MEYSLMKLKKLKNSIKFIVNGMTIILTTDNIHIQDSFKVKYRKEMRTILDEMLIQIKECQITMDTPFNHRSIESMVNEWLAHNNLYQLGYKVEQTGHVDLNYPQPWYITLAYWFLSRITL